MNHLVEVLRDHPSIVSQVSDGVGRVGLSDLVEAFREHAPRLAERLDDDAIGALASSHEHGELLRESYLAPVPTMDWIASVQEASPPPAGSPGEWVTFVLGAQDHMGLTLPQDNAPVDRVSLFAGGGTAGRRVSIDYDGAQPVDLSVSEMTHCTLPDWGKCDPGQCGTCRPFRQESDENGLVCMCDDDL